MRRRKFLLGTGALAAGGAATLGSGAFSRVESQRDVTIEVAEDPDAYLGLEPAETPNGQNFAYIDDYGHLSIGVGDFADAEHNDDQDYSDRPTGEGVNTNSTTWFDCVFEVRNQGKEDAGFYIEGQGGLGTGEGEIDFYVGSASGSQGDSGITSIVGLPVEIELDSGEAVCVGVRVNSPEEPGDLSEALFDDEITMIADVDVEGSEIDGLESVFNVTQNLAYNTIQSAINGANEGDTIEVGEGTYEESVDIDVEGLTLEAADGASPAVVSQESPEFSPSQAALFINANNVTVNGVDAVEGISPSDNQDIIEINGGVSGTVLTNLAVESPDFTGASGEGQGAIGHDGAIGDLTVENVESDRTIGLQAEAGAEIEFDDIDVTKSGDGSEAIFITGPGWEDAKIDLTIESVTPQDNEEETGDSTDLLLFGDEATVNDVDGDAQDLADAVFNENEDIDEVEIGGEVITR